MEGVTATRTEEVRRLVAEGLTDAEIAARLGIARKAVGKARRRLGLMRRATPAAPVSDEVFLALHAEDLDNAEISRRTGMTRATVRERLSRLRLRSHPTPEQLAARFGASS